MPAIFMGDRARVRLALREATRRHLFDPNVTMIDFGRPRRDGCLCEDEVAIRVHVRRKLAGARLESAVEDGLTARIPCEIGGIPTDVTEGRYHPHFLMPVRSRLTWLPGRSWGAARGLRALRADPMRGGISISDAAQRAYGTLGGLVVDRASGAPLLLSNWHVLVNNWSARPGLPIYQPGRLDGGTSADAVAWYARDAMAVNLDAAVAAIGNARRLINDQVEVGVVRGLAVAELGMELVKSGRGSGRSFGRVMAVEGTARMRYAGVERIIRHCVTIEPRADGAPVSTAGDSGSLWLALDTRCAVALHFAGSNVPERALAMDLAPVLNALDVDLAAAFRPA